MGKTFNTGRLGNGLFVDANGNVGIGTSSPTEKLSVIGNIRIDNGAADGGQLVLASSGYSDWNIDNYSGTLRAYYGSTVIFSLTNAGAATFSSSVTASGVSSSSYYVINSNGNDTITTRFYQQDTLATTANAINMQMGASGGFQFWTYSSSAWNNRMTITGAGNVGIGTSSPGASLDISSTATYVLNLNNTAQDTRLAFQNSGTQNFQISTSSSQVNLYGPTNIPMLFYTNATERMRISSGGTVAINSTYSNTVYKLVTKVGTDRNIAFGIQGGDCSIESFNDAVNVSTPLRIYGNPVSFLGGNVGIGTTSPGAKLDLNGTFSQQGVQRVCYAGSIQGNQSITVTVNHANQSSFKISCAMNHYGFITGYGCAKLSFFANGPGSSEVVVSDTSTGNGGSWSIARVDTNNFTITKNAGSYGGGGNFMIEVVGNYIVGIS